MSLLPGEVAQPALPGPRGRRAGEIVETFRRILEAEGTDAPSMRRVADELGIKAPSLYKHYSSKADIESELVADSMTELGVALHRAIQESGDESPLMSLLTAYRSSCLGNPALHLLATEGSFNRDRLPPGLEDWAGNPFFVVTGDPSLAQALWSFAHGMITLELRNRFPPGSDLDSTWRAGGTAFEHCAELFAISASTCT